MEALPLPYRGNDDPVDLCPAEREHLRSMGVNILDEWGDSD
jgi:hypothetical protein